jgi:hypothetical protein
MSLNRRLSSLMDLHHEEDCAGTMAHAAGGAEKFVGDEAEHATLSITPLAPRRCPA